METTARRARRSSAPSASARHTVTVTVRNGDAVIGTATKTINVFAPATGNVALSAPANADTDADAQIAASLPGQDVTIEVYRAGVNAYPLVASGPTRLKYRSPIAATDDVVACAAAGQSCVTSGTHARRRRLQPARRPDRAAHDRLALGRRAAELWDGETLAGWEYAGTGTVEPQRHGLAAGRRRQRRQRRRPLLRRARVQGLRAVRGLPVAATNSNGGVLLRFPRPATMADADRNGYQVAVLDNGTAATRSGAIVQERPALSYAPSNAVAAKPTREWNTLTIPPSARTSPCASTACSSSQYHDATRRRRPHRARERGHRRDVPARADQRVRRDRRGTVGGTVPATLALDAGRRPRLRRVHPRRRAGPTRPRRPRR